MTMDLDDMKQAWQQLDQRMVTLEHDAVRQSVQGHLRGLWVGQWLLVLMGAGLALVAGSFWFDHRDHGALLVAGLALHVYALIFIVTGARNLYLQSRIDYAAPVVAIQQSLAGLRHWRATWEGWVFGVANCFAWVPMLMVLFAWAGVDIWRTRPAMVGWWMVVACIGLLVFIGIMRWGRTNPSVQRLLDCNSVGAGLRRAGTTLDELEHFSRD